MNLLKYSLLSLINKIYRSFGIFCCGMSNLGFGKRFYYLQNLFITLKFTFIMTFEIDKKNALSREDKSRAGKIDEPIVELVNKVNADPDYYTTSSCSGRITLIDRRSKKKSDAKWLYKTHEQADAEDCWKIVEEYVAQKKEFVRIIVDEGNCGEGVLWLLLEGMILHVACRNQRKAEELLNLARPKFKHSGVIALGDKWVVEIRSSERMEVPISIADINGDCRPNLVNKEEFFKMIEIGNEKIEDNKKAIDKFLKEFI